MTATWWELASPRIHTAGGCSQAWPWYDALRVLHDHELFVVARPFRGEIEVGRRVLALEGPAWALVPSGSPHVCRGTASGAWRGWVHFDWTAEHPRPPSLFTYGERAAAGAVHRAPPWAPEAPCAGRLGDSSLVRALQELVRLRSGGGTYGAVRARSLLLEILVRVLSPEAEVSDGAARSALAERVRERLDQAAGLPVSTAPPLPRLLAELGRDSDHLSRVFRQVFGVAPVRYLIEQRVGRACARLREGRGLGAVAAELGYGDRAYLSRLVRRVTGHPPSWHVGRQGSQRQLRR
jgi:AraC-like DNA-binding protein